MKKPRRLALVLAAALGAALAGAAPAEQPDPEARHAAVRQVVTEHLEEKLWPWWLNNSPDGEHGGFLTELNRDGSARSGRKTLVSQARQIWAFSRMWNDGFREPGTLKAARSGVEFLQEHFWDEAHDGWFWEVDRAGKLQDAEKRTYGHAFVIYAAVEFYRASGEEIGLQIAEQTFDALEKRAKDPEFAGYVDHMDRRWQPIGRAPGHRSMNTQLHLLEALAELYLETGEEIHGRRLREILDALTEHAYLEQYGCCVETFNRDWTPVTEGWAGRRNRYTSYGHNVEFAWLMQRTARVLGLPPERYRQIGLSLIDHALRYGWHEGAGALSGHGPLEGRPSEYRMRMSWWMQAENLVALDWAWRETGNERYLEALERQAEWVTDEQSDPLYGGWWDTVAPDGAVLNRRKAHVWHAAYHEVRGCLNVGIGRWGPEPSAAGRPVGEQ
jgi:mannobiose 2-epimerase